MKTIHSRRSGSAFTLIELLVVISIIAILAGLTLSGAQTAMLSAKKVQARNDMAQISLGVTSYYTEYGRYPINSAATSDQTFGTSTLNNDWVICVLRDKLTTPANEVTQNTLDTLNPRQIQFLQPKVQTVKKGCVNTADGNWYDPWGLQYIIFIDGDYTGEIDLSKAFSGIPNPSFGVGVASVGYAYAKKGLAPPSPPVLPSARAYDSITDLLSWQ